MLTRSVRRDISRSCFVERLISRFLAQRRGYMRSALYAFVDGAVLRQSISFDGFSNDAGNGWFIIFCRSWKDGSHFSFAIFIGVESLRITDSHIRR